MDGLSFSPFEVSFGIRTNDPSVLPELRTIISDLGWTEQSREIVDVLFSLWVGRPSPRGRRAYHLLYGGAIRMVRSLELDDVFVFLRGILPDVARATATGYWFFPGSKLNFQGRDIVLLPQPCEADTGRSGHTSYFALDNQGRLQGASGRAAPLLFLVSQAPNFDLRSCSKGEAGVRLFQSTLGLRSRPDILLRATSDFVKASSCWELKTTSWVDFWNMTTELVNRKFT